MRPVWSSLSTIGLFLSLVGPPAMAAPPTPPTAVAAPDRDAEQVLLIAEDLRVLEALDPLKLSASQIDELIPVLDGAQARLKQLAAEKKRALANWKTSLVQAREQALHGGKPSSRLQQQLLLLQDTSERKERQARMDLVITISAKLARALSAEQATRVKTLTQTTLVGQPSPFALAGEATDGDSARSTDLHEKIARELDKLRSAKPGPQYEIRRVKFIDQFMKGMDPDAPGYQKQLNALFNQAGEIHEMTPETFEQQKQTLLANYVQMRYAAMVRVQANRADKQSGVGPLNHSTGLELFVEKVLMSPRAALVLRELQRTLA